MKRKTLLFKSAFILSAITALPFFSAAQPIACGGSHTISICGNKTVRAWGYNVNGELGNATNTDSNVPVQVGSLNGIIAVSGGYEYYSIALKSDGTVWSWGDNYYGQLGNGTTTDSNVPTQVSNLSGIIAIVAGGWHCLALKNDGTVWSWGYNNYGQLGNWGSNSTIPVAVNVLTGITAIAAGIHHSIALKNDGTVWTWGRNGNGQLGDGTTTHSGYPQQINSLTGITAIAGGNYHSIALKNNGTVWSWGTNYYGELGNGTFTDSHVPVQINSLSGIIAVAGATDHSLVLKNDGTVMTFGGNLFGQLGNGTNTNSNVPVSVSSLSGAIAISGGFGHSCAMKSDSTIWAWGRNGFGQLGNGNNIDSNVPTQVTGLCHSQIGINEITEQTSLSVFPNPTNGQFTISLEDIKFQKTGAELEIYNVLGEKVYSEKVQNQKTVTLNLDEPNGIYFITLKSGEQNYYQKLIKH